MNQTTTTSSSTGTTEHFSKRRLSANTSTTTPAKTNDSLDAIDQVFTIAGFDSCYLNSAESPNRPHIRVKDANSPMVLHIDDDIDLVDALTSRLRASGFRVACALDGVTGIQAALLNPASAIILDYDMPNGRGDMVMDLIKKNERTRNIPVVVLTAIHKRGLKKEMLAKGANAFMTKPFEFDELRDLVSKLIEQNDSESDL